MPLRVQIVRHDPATAAAFVGLEGEVTFELINNRLHLHDNITPGGKVVENVDAVQVLIDALGTTTAAADLILTNGKMNRSVINSINEIVIGTAASTEGVLAVPAGTIPARLATGDLVAATPAEIRTLLDVDVQDTFLGSIADLGTAADKLIKTTAIDVAAEIDITAAGEAMLSAADAVAQLTLLDGQTTAAINAAITAGIDLLIPAGTVMCFFQAAAPPGWTQVTTHNDKVFRVVSGAGAGFAGDWTISGVTVDGHILTEVELPAHTHTYDKAAEGVFNPGTNPTISGRASITPGSATGSVGGDTAHVHGLTADGLWRPAYIDVILASRDV